MNPALQFYIILVIVGLFLIGAEIFLPGGVIGLLGFLSLAGAVALGFQAFGPQGGLLSALLIVVFCGICVALWVKFFPRTSVGRQMTLSDDGKAFKTAPEELKKLAGEEGTALSTLRPAGIATIGGRRVDVVADGSWIENGRRIKVIRVEGLRILVRELPQAPETKGAA